MSPLRSGSSPHNRNNGTKQRRHLREECNGNAHSTLHRVSMVRKRQGVSLRTAARQLNLDISQVRELELASRDLKLSQIYAWQQLLNVPIAELLVECDQPLSPPVMRRAQLLRLMKTAASLQNFSDSPAIQRLSTMLKEQLVEIMPELEGVGAWQGGDPDTASRNYEPVRYRIPQDWSGAACNEER